MKTVILSLFIFAFVACSCKQTKKQQEQVIVVETAEYALQPNENGENIDVLNFQKEFDFSPLWMDKRIEYLGYIGDNYQRLYMFIETVDKISDTYYQISGRSRVKSNVCNFKGFIMLKTIREFTEEEFEYGVDNWMKGKFTRQGIIIANFLLEENQSQKGSGIFRGTLQTKWYVDMNDELKYDDILDDTDGYANNQFSGTWTSYLTKLSKKCAWGHYRIPDAGDLDIGAAEFSVNPKYANNGWKK